MNMGSDEGAGGGVSGVSPYRKLSSPVRNGSSPTRSSMDSRSVSNWKSYDSQQPSNDPGEGPVIPKFDIDPDVPLEEMAPIVRGHSEESESDGGAMPAGLIIGDELVKGPDPLTQEEMQRKKERIMMQSLRRKQQAEENRIRKEEELREKREEENKREEDKARKREEAQAKRDAILEMHRHKKEMEKMTEADRGMPEPVTARPVPKLRSSSTAGRPTRPRPKTIHVDQDQDVGHALASSRGTRGSSSNISGEREQLARISLCHRV